MPDMAEVDDLPSTDPNTAGAFRNAMLGNLVGGTFDPSVLDAELLKGWVVGLNRREVTHTWYDEPIPGNTLPSNFVQRNLRMRVASTTFQEEYNEDPTVYDHASHYSGAWPEQRRGHIHGNVADLLQDHPQMDLDGGGVGLGHRFKRMLYHYDLISGNVKEVWYQPRKPDAMYHRYDYDADNRITRVETSVDRQNWYIDAEYMYYPHGPLERMELGQSKVQGVDYAYTLQGWLKGINSERLVPANDMGLDGVVAAGNENAAVGRDAFGMSLGYYGDGDYEAIDGSRWDNAGGTRPFAPVGSTGTLSAAHNPLYNGNIAHTVNTLQPFGTWTGTSGEQGQVLAQVYRYDQLNRLREAQGVQGMDADNTWNGVLDATANRYRSEYTYDANGNIETTQRWDQNGTQYDDFSYHYPGTEPQINPTAVPSKRTGNRLHQLYDEATATTGSDIANNPSTFLPGEFPVWDENINTDYNYGYDALGNLIRDNEAEIEAIEWTVTGKVKVVESSSSDPLRNLSFGYSSDGNRIMKQVGPDPTGSGLGFREHYIRDTQGNIMAVYRYDNNDGLSLKLTQRPIYGSSRLGTYDREKQLHGQDLLTPPSVYSIPTEFMSAADRRYELTDHLGNVSAVVTGQLVPGNGATPYQPVLISAQGYEAFGSLLPVRNFSSGSYRWGFNGAEKDDDLNGSTGTSYDFGARVYDPRIARFFSLDPFKDKLPAISPYAFAANSPIAFIDAEGKYPIIKINSYSATSVDGKTILKVNLDISINVAVLNQSSTVLTAAEGADIAAYIDAKGVSGAYSGALYGSDATTAGVAFHKQGGAVEIQYEVNFSFKARYVKDASEVRDGEQVLILTDSHRPDPDRDIGGRADYYNGVASIDFEYATPGAVQIQSLGRQTKRSNGGVHELAHLIGFGDIYTKTRTVPGHLMGELGMGFLLGQGEIDNVVWSALIEVKNYNIQKANNTKTTYYQTKDGTYMPKFEGTVSKRIEDHKQNVGARTR